MHPGSARHALATLGFAGDLGARVRALGHVVGRGEGFVSREWRGAYGLGVAAHYNAADLALVCAQPFVAGLARTPWELVAVTHGTECQHCATARVRSGTLELTAALPDYAARRKMLPLGLAVQASLVVVAQTLRAGELASFVTPVADGAADAVVVAGSVRSVVVQPSGEGADTLVRVELERDGARLWVVGPRSDELREGAAILATGHALVRIGAPLAVRRAAEGPVVS